MMKIAPLFLVLVLTACGGNDKPPVEKPDPNAPKMIGCQGGNRISTRYLFLHARINRV
jgi:hypothetical protein